MFAAGSARLADYNRATRRRPTTVLGTYAHLLPHSDEMAAETVAAVLADKPLTTVPTGETQNGFLMRSRAACGQIPLL
jgi:hypothetical protein